MKKIALIFMFVSLLGVVLTSVLVGLPAVAKADSITILNPSFDIPSPGSLEDWSAPFGGVTAEVPVAGGLESSSDYAAVFSSPSSNAILGQTVSDTAGHNYSINFWVLDETPATATTSTFTGGSLTIYGGKNASGQWNDPYHGVWHEYSYILNATGNNAITFNAANTGSDGYFALDQISGASTPEPATILLVGVGLLGLAVLGRKLHS